DSIPAKPDEPRMRNALNACQQLRLLRRTSCPEERRWTVPAHPPVGRSQAPTRPARLLVGEVGVARRFKPLTEELFVSWVELVSTIPGSNFCKAFGKRRKARTAGDNQVFHKTLENIL